jgi:hypothetical protein
MSRMVRHGLTAIHWLRAPAYAVTIAATEAEALEQLEQIRAGAAAKVREVLDDLRKPDGAR